MYKNILQAISGIEIYPVLSLLIFFLLFAIVVAWALTLDKKHVRRMACVPLETTRHDVEFHQFDHGGSRNGDH